MRKCINATVQVSSAQSSRRQDYSAVTALRVSQDAAAAADSLPGPLPSQTSPVKRPGALRTFRSARLRHGTQVGALSRIWNPSGILFFRPKCSIECADEQR